MNITLNGTSKKGATAVFIKTEARKGLFEELKPYIQENDYNILTELINGKTLDIPITVNCKQNTLGKVFYEAYRKKCTESTKKAFAHWIWEHFQRKAGGEIYSLSVSTIENHLKGKGISKY